MEKIEQRQKINNKIQEGKKVGELIYSKAWRDVVDPILEDEFEKTITMALLDIEKEHYYMSNARAIFNLCDKLGKKINLGEVSKKKLKELQNKR